MKTSEIASGLVYAHKKTRVWGQAEAALVLDTKLWTRGEVWRSDADKGSRRVYEIGLASEGSRARASTYGHGEVGIPVLITSEFYFQRTGDDKIQETAEALLTQAAIQMDVENLHGRYEKGQYPDSEAKVTATTADGSKVTVVVRLALVAPQTILALWNEYLQAAIDEKQRRMAYEARQRGEANRARDETLDVANRLNALLGENPDRHETGHRSDLKRKNDGDFQIKPEALLALIELAEAGRQ
jgi:hypothetical protein